MSILGWWLVPDRVPPAPDCFVIPSYGLRDRHRPTRPTRAEIELAVQWWRRFPHAKIIMSTGDNQRLGVSNAQVMVDYAVELGVPRAVLIQEARSHNTRENLLFSMEIIQENAFQHPTLVTLDLYTRRAVATAQKLGWRDFYWLSVFSEGEPAFGAKRFQTGSRVSIFCYEVGAMVYSKIAGWV